MGTKGITYLGINGGGTRCHARIEDENGRLLGEASSGPAISRIGVERAWRSIMEASEAAATQAGLKREDFSRMHAGTGLAGLGRRGAEAAPKKIAHPFASVVLISDGMAACLGAHSGADGAIVVAGTGSVGVGLIGPRNPSRRIRLSSLGRRQRGRHRPSGRATGASGRGSPRRDDSLAFGGAGHVRPRSLSGGSLV